MNISKTRFINWTRCPMYFPMDMKLNPTGKADIDDERERREERLAELREGVKSSDGFDAEDEEFDAQPGSTSPNAQTSTCIQKKTSQK